MGQGLHTKMMAIAAQHFGLPMSSIHIAETSTDKVANASPTAASVSADLNGAAVLDACKQISQRLETVKQNLGSIIASGISRLMRRPINILRSGYHDCKRLLTEPLGGHIGFLLNRFA